MNCVCVMDKLFTQSGKHISSNIPPIFLDQTVAEQTLSVVCYVPQHILIKCLLFTRPFTELDMCWYLVTRYIVVMNIQYCNHTQIVKTFRLHISLFSINQLKCMTLHDMYAAYKINQIFTLILSFEKNSKAKWKCKFML